MAWTHSRSFVTRRETCHETTPERPGVRATGRGATRHVVCLHERDEFALDDESLSRRRQRRANDDEMTSDFDARDAVTRARDVVVAIAMVCCACVQTGQVGVVQRCGKFHHFARPGCQCINPLTCEGVAGTISTRLQQLDTEVETKTKDNVFVVIVVSTQFMVLPEDSHLYDAFYKLTDTKAQMRAYVFDVVRSTVPRIKLDDVFESKEEIAQSVKEMLEKAMRDFGYQIINTLVTDIAPDARVKQAMNEINAAQRARVAAQDRAEADKIMVVKAAEADAESKYLAGTGMARQRQAIIAGLRESVLDFQNEVSGISSKDVLDLMMMTQYYDTLKEIGTAKGSNTIFLPSGPSAVAEAASAIRNGMMQAHAAANPPHV